jgi:hypothetical protein
LKNFKVAKFALGNTQLFNIRIRPQDLSLEPIVVDVFSFQEVLDYAANNVRDILEVSFMKDIDAVLDFKLVYFDRLNKWNLFFEGKNLMLDHLDLDIFKNYLEPLCSDLQKNELKELND